MSENLESIIKSFFDDADQNKDGKISLADYGAAKSGAAYEKAKKQFDAVLGQWDANKDGELTFEEFKAKFQIPKNA